MQNQDGGVWVRNSHGQDLEIKSPHGGALSSRTTDVMEYGRHSFWVDVCQSQSQQTKSHRTRRLQMLIGKVVCYYWHRRRGWIANQYTRCFCRYFDLPCSFHIRIVFDSWTALSLLSTSPLLPLLSIVASSFVTGLIPYVAANSLYLAAASMNQAGTRERQHLSFSLVHSQEKKKEIHKQAESNTVEQGDPVLLNFLSSQHVFFVSLPSSPDSLSCKLYAW